MGRSKMTLNNSNKSMKTKKQWKNQNLLAVLTFFCFSVESLFTTRILQGCSDGRRVIFAHNAAWSHLGRGWAGEGETAADEESGELTSLRSSAENTFFLFLGKTDDVWGWVCGSWDLALAAQAFASCVCNHCCVFSFPLCRFFWILLTNLLQRTQKGENFQPP